MILQLFARHHERYGSPRMHQALVIAGWSVSRRRVARLMAAAGLRAKAVRGYRATVRFICGMRGIRTCSGKPR